MNANETVEFFRAVVADPAKCDRLKSAEDLETFLQSAAEIGEEIGYAPDIERLRAVAAAAGQGSDGPSELSDEELENVDAGMFNFMFVRFGDGITGKRG